MKNFLRLLGIIAMVAVIGFSMAGCGGGDDGTPGTSGKLTITGFDEYNGKYVIAFLNSYYLQKSFLAADGISEDWTFIDAVMVSDGKAVFKVWDVTNYKVRSYNGDDGLTFTLLVYENTPVPYANNKFDPSYIATDEVSASFNKGIAFAEKFIPSVEAPLSDSRFNGTFTGAPVTWTTGVDIWIFNGTNKGNYTSRLGGDHDFEIKLENGHFWERLWNNPFSSWNDKGEYSFNQDGNTLKIGNDTFTKN